LALIQNALYE
jgi:hypothetical protein